MKIAFVDEDLSPRTGSRRFTYEVSRHLQELGNQVRILTTKIDRNTCFKEYLSLPFEVISGKQSSGGRFQASLQRPKRNSLIEMANDFQYYYWKQTQMAIKISEKIADEQCDVAMLHYHGEHWLLPFFYHLREATGVVYLNVVPPMPRPRALPFQELTLRRRIVDRLLDLPPVGGWKKRSFKRLSMFLTPSKFQLEQARKAGIIRQKKASVVPLGVNHSEFYPTDEEEHYALYMGRIHPHKSLELAILSMKNTPEDYSLIIAGDIEGHNLWYKDKLVSLADKTNVSSRLKIVLSPSDSQVVELMQRCSAFLFPSTIDTFGLVVLEAMACGKPIVACNRGGVPEIVGDAGFLLEPNPGQWQEVVSRLLCDAELRVRMGKKASKRSEKFSWGSTTRRLVLALSNLSSKYIPSVKTPSNIPLPDMPDH